MHGWKHLSRGYLSCRAVGTGLGRSNLTGAGAGGFDFGAGAGTGFVFGGGAGAAGAGAIGYDKMNDGEIGRLGAAGGAAGILALLGQPRVYNQIARSAELGGAPLGFTMQNAAPFLGMQAGRIFNEGQ